MKHKRTAYILITWIVLLTFAWSATAEENFLIGNKGPYEQSISLLNAYLQSGANSGTIEIQAVFDNFVETGKVGKYSIEFRNYSEILLLLDQGNYNSALERCTDLKDSQAYSDFRSYLANDEEWEERGFYAIGTVDDLHNYVQGRVCEANKNYEKASIYYDDCRTFFDAYDRYYQVKKLIPDVTPTPTPSPKPMPANTPTPTPKPTEEPYQFADSAVEAEVRRTLGVNVTIYVEDLAKIRTLDVSSKQVKSLKDLPVFPNLFAFDANNCGLSDISPLANCEGLKSLTLRGNRISDISPLSNLTDLETLWLDENQITDINVLSKLTKLQWLDVSDNKITDISALSKLTEMDSLDLQNNVILDLSPLDGMSKLTSLRLWDTGEQHIGYNVIQNLKRNGCSVWGDEYSRWLDNNVVHLPNDWEDNRGHICARGSNSEYVAQIQEALIAKGYLNDTADGAFGPKTEKALSAYQKDNQFFGTYGIGTQLTKIKLLSKNEFSATSSEVVGAAFNSVDSHTFYYYKGSDRSEYRIMINFKNISDMEVTAVSAAFFFEDKKGNPLHEGVYTALKDCDNTVSPGEDITINIKNEYQDPNVVLRIRIDEVLYSDGRIYTDFKWPDETDYWYCYPEDSVNNL